jgi:hypothetical protein
MAGKDPETAPNTTTEHPQPEQLYSIFPKWQRGTLVYIASLAAFASPVSSTIYYPAMETLAHDLNTSLTNISLTITTYMVRRYNAPLSTHYKTHLSRADIPRRCTYDCRRDLRPMGSQTSLSPLIYGLCCCQRRIGFAKQLCCIDHPALFTKLR